MIKQHPIYKTLFVSSCGTAVYYEYDRAKHGMAYHNKKYLTPPNTQPIGALKYPACFLLTPDIDRYGYVIYSLPKPIGMEHHNNPRKKIKAHQLVAQTFLNNPFDHIVIHHRDNNHTNNHMSNLEWVLLAKNNHESNTGFNTLAAYSDELKLKALDMMVNKGLHYKEVSYRTGILVNTLVEAKRQKTWKRVWRRFNDQSQDVPSSEGKRDTSKDDDMVCS
jgi:hypothetical protein